MTTKKQPPTPKQIHNIVPDLVPLAYSVELIQPDPKNPRTGHDITGIAKSLESYGQRKPIVVNKKNNHIEAGTGTYRAVTELLHWTHVAVVFVEDGDDVQSSYNLADNRLTDLSFFDPDKFIEMLMSVDGDVPGTSTIREMVTFVDDEPEWEPEEEDGLSEFRQVLSLHLLDNDFNRFVAVKTKLKLKSDEDAFLKMLEAVEEPS